MKVFVTGATGFIGRALVLALQRKGHSVIAWVRDEARARALLGEDVELLGIAKGEGVAFVAVIVVVVLRNVYRLRMCFFILLYAIARAFRGACRSSTAAAPGWTPCRTRGTA